MKSRREMLEEFVAADASDSFSRYALALELEKENRQREAIEQLREVIARDPSYVAAYYHLGRLLAVAGEMEEARAIYTRGLDAAGKAGDQRTRNELQEALDALG
ncbi:MAG TPA: tetratricopeptide repeat protein [Blastocatellia bacterium]|jgi:tetratricopeptide (TPR) repeat protein